MVSSLFPRSEVVNDRCDLISLLPSTRESSPRAECEGQAASLTEAEWHSIEGEGQVAPARKHWPPRASALILVAQTIKLIDLECFRHVKLDC